jgi:chorismate mutase
MANKPLEIAPIQGWFPCAHPFRLISGPCSAETREQVMEDALRLSKDHRVGLLRAGIWKPRTRPDSFEGVGEIGLTWLQEAREATGLPFTVEVARAEHVEAALKAGTDVLWIGARTTVNPFSVQEIADALKGVSIPVMVKNPINPDVQLWLGAFERLQKSGITQMAAIHRGFSTVDAAPYRNAPRWDLAIQLRTLVPDLPVFCDPSHITGKRDYLFEVAQKAIHFAFDGLMIEAHPTPDQAWSDAAQQVTPEELFTLLDGLNLRFTQPQNSEAAHQLMLMRQLIDSIDEELMRLLSRRMKTIQDIGDYKKVHHVTIFQPERWQEILETRIEWSKSLHLDERFVRKILMEIHKQGLQIQADQLEGRI